MAIKESLLTVVNSIGDSDFVRAVTSAGASRKLSVSNLAKHIVETYNGSTIAGSAQSVKSAVDNAGTQITALNNMFRNVAWQANADLNNFTTTGFYWISTAPTNGPTGWVWFSLEVISRSDTVRQIAISNNGVVAVRKYQANEWGSWEILATKSAVDALTSRFGNLQMSYLSQTVTVPAGSEGSPATVTVTFDDAPNNFKALIAYLNDYALPYFGTSSSARTWVSRVLGKSVTISNTTSAWNNYTLYVFGIFNA